MVVVIIIIVVILLIIFVPMLIELLGEFFSWLFGAITTLLGWVLGIAGAIVALFLFFCAGCYFEVTLDKLKNQWEPTTVDNEEDDKKNVSSIPIVKEKINKSAFIIYFCVTALALAIKCIF